MPRLFCPPPKTNVPPETGAYDRQARTIKVMLVDDSLTVRTVFTRMLSLESDIEIAAEAGTAERALSLLESETIEVILLDLQMPGMGGLEALPKLIKAGSGAQILVVSSLAKDGAEATLSALAIGAADTLLKPSPGKFDANYRKALLEKIRGLSDKKSICKPADKRPSNALSKQEPTRSHSRKPPKIAAIGASTGGIHALNAFFRALPISFELPILLTQHLPSSFMKVFVQQIELASARRTILAKTGLKIKANTVYIAPGDAHLRVAQSGEEPTIELSNGAVQSGCLPSVDPMFESCARAYEGNMAAILLSGMGRDGTHGARQAFAFGATLLAQDEQSCAVWGMPRVIAQQELADYVASPAKLAGHLAEIAATRQTAC